MLRKRLWTALLALLAVASAAGGAFAGELAKVDLQAPETAEVARPAVFTFKALDAAGVLLSIDNCAYEAKLGSEQAYPSDVVIKENEGTGTLTFMPMTAKPLSLTLSLDITGYTGYTATATKKVDVQKLNLSKADLELMIWGNDYTQQITGFAITGKAGDPTSLGLTGLLNNGSLISLDKLPTKVDVDVMTGEVPGTLPGGYDFGWIGMSKDVGIAVEKDGKVSITQEATDGVERVEIGYEVKGDEIDLTGTYFGGIPMSLDIKGVVLSPKEQTITVPLGMSIDVPLTVKGATLPGTATFDFPSWLPEMSKDVAVVKVKSSTKDKITVEVAGKNEGSTVGKLTFTPAEGDVFKNIPSVLLSIDVTSGSNSGNSFRPQRVELTEEKKALILSSLQKLMPGVDLTKVPMFTIGDSQVKVGGNLRSFEDLIASQQILVSHDTKVPAAILPEINIKEMGIFCFETSLDKDVPENSTLEWHSFVSLDVTERSLSVRLAKDGDGDKTAVFMKNGEAITEVPGDHEIEVAAYLKKGTYTPVIAADTSTANHRSPTSDKGSGGGCDAGFAGFLGLTLLSSVVWLRKR